MPPPPATPPMLARLPMLVGRLLLNRLLIIPLNTSSLRNSSMIAAMNCLVSSSSDLPKSFHDLMPPVTKSEKVLPTESRPF